MVNLNCIWNIDCLIGMHNLPNKSVDCVVCDLPYNTTNCLCDNALPFDELWKQYKRIVKDNGAILLFGQEPFSSQLRLSNLKDYKYDIYWQKERITNVFQLNKRPGKVIETISVFYNKQCTYNPQMSIHTGPKVTNKIKNGRMGKLVDASGKPPTPYVDKGTRYPLQIVRFQRDYYTVGSLHPTQKPVALIEYLIKTYTNEGDIVLDNCMGSGTTAIAAINTQRNFIGYEKDDKYWAIAMNRIYNHRQ